MITAVLRIEIKAPKRTVLQHSWVGRDTLDMYSSKFLPRPVRFCTKLSPQNGVWGKFGLNAKAFGNKGQRVNAMKLTLFG